MEERNRIAGARWYKDVDWIFLIFLLIFLNQSNFSLKAVGIVFIYALRPDFNFRMSSGRIPRFYLYIIPLALVNLLLNIHEFTYSYLAAFGMACGMWILSFLAYHQLRLSVEKFGSKNINTLKVFTVLNFAASIVQLLHIMYITHTVNPYRGLDFPYGLSTGDNVFGVYMQNCYYNVMTTAFLTIYFLYKQKYLYMFLSVATLALVFANSVTLIFLATLLMIFFAGVIADVTRNAGKSALSQWIQRLRPPGRYYLTIPLMFVFIYALSDVISPENVSYTVESFLSKIHQGVTRQDKSRLVAINVKTDELKQQTEARKDTVVVAKQYTHLMNEKEALSVDFVHKFKGKKLSLVETFMYLRSSPRAMLFGAGPVRFSSLTAQKMAGYDSSKIFKKILPRYSSKLYDENHKLIIKARAESTNEYRSTINWPDSVYNQILGEYGILGAVLFLVFYVWFFVRRIRNWSYGFWLSALMVPFAFFSYMFEPLAIVIIFEFLMETDIRECMEHSIS